MGSRLQVAGLVLLLLVTAHAAHIRDYLMSHIQFRKSYDVVDVNDSTLLLLVDYHEDILQPRSVHVRNGGFHAEHYARLVQNGYKVHRRLSELLATKFFPHKIDEGTSPSRWFDSSSWRGRVIVTREAVPSDSCRFQLETTKFPDAKELVKNNDLRRAIDTLSTNGKDLLPEECSKKTNKPLFVKDACKIKDLDEPDWPWTATSRMRTVGSMFDAPPLQGEHCGDAWLYGVSSQGPTRNENLPNLHTFLLDIINGVDDELFPINEGRGSRNTIRFGGVHGMQQPRVLQAIRGRNKHVRTVSPFGLVEQTTERGTKLLSYSSIYDYPRKSMPRASGAEMNGQPFGEINAICKAMTTYKRAYSVMHGCFASTGCPFGKGGVVEDCCRDQRMKLTKAETALYNAMGQKSGAHKFFGKSSLAEAFAMHVCGFDHIKPLRVYIAGVGLPAVLGAAHDAVLLAQKLNRFVEVVVLEDMVVDYELVEQVTPDSPERVGDWAREFWARWIRSCNAVFPACARARELFSSSPRVCLAPPCVPEVVQDKVNVIGNITNAAMSALGRLKF